MKKAWLYAHGKVCSSVFDQEKTLKEYCKENNIEVAGETHLIASDDGEYAILEAIRNALDHECDCIMVQEAKNLKLNINTYTKLLEAYVQNGVVVYALDKGEMYDAIFKLDPLLRLNYSPDIISLDYALEEGEQYEYPEKRNLDFVHVRVNRKGETHELSFTDLDREERMLAISSLPQEALVALCKKLADNLRYIGDAFGIVQTEQGIMFATKCKVASKKQREKFANRAE